MLPSTQESLTQGLFSTVESRAQDIISLFGYSGERKPEIWQVTVIRVQQRSFQKIEKKHSNREGLRERPLLPPSVLSSLDTILTGTSCHWAGVDFPMDRTV